MQRVLLAVFGFVVATAGFSLVKRSVSGSDSPTVGAPITLTNANALVFTLTGAQVFVGVGGVLNTNGTPLNAADDTVDSSAGIGLAASVSSLTLATVTTGGLTPTKYTGLEISGLAGALVGISGVTATVSQVNVKLNQVSGPLGTERRLDWAGFTPTGQLPAFGMDETAQLSAAPASSSSHFMTFLKKTCAVGGALVGAYLDGDGLSDVVDARRRIKNKHVVGCK